MSRLRRSRTRCIFCCSSVFWSVRSQRMSEACQSGPTGTGTNQSSAWCKLGSRFECAHHSYAMVVVGYWTTESYVWIRGSQQMSKISRQAPRGSRNTLASPVFREGIIMSRVPCTSGGLRRGRQLAENAEDHSDVRSSVVSGVTIVRSSCENLCNLFSAGIAEAGLFSTVPTPWLGPAGEQHGEQGSFTGRGKVVK